MASVGAVSDDLMVYFEPLFIPVAVMKVHVLLIATGNWNVTRFLGSLVLDPSAKVL